MRANGPLCNVVTPLLRCPLQQSSPAGYDREFSTIGQLSGPFKAPPTGSTEGIAPRYQRRFDAEVFRLIYWEV